MHPVGVRLGGAMKRNEVGHFPWRPARMALINRSAERYLNPSHLSGHELCVSLIRQSGILGHLCQRLKWPARRFLLLSVVAFSETADQSGFSLPPPNVLSETLVCWNCRENWLSCHRQTWHFRRSRQMCFLTHFGWLKVLLVFGCVSRRAWGTWLQCPGVTWPAGPRHVTRGHVTWPGGGGCVTWPGGLQHCFQVLSINAWKWRGQKKCHKFI